MFFPNPASTAVNIELANNKIAESITLINSIGQVIKTKNNSNIINVSEEKKWGLLPRSTIR